MLPLGCPCGCVLGGEARDCSLALVLGVVHTVLARHAPAPIPIEQIGPCMDHLTASFAVHQLRSQVREVQWSSESTTDTTRQRLIDGIMGTLDAVARICYGLSRGGHRDISSLQLECTQARTALDQFHEKCGVQAASGFVLPPPEELQGQVEAMVSAPSPRYVSVLRGSEVPDCQGGSCILACPYQVQ